MSLFAASVLLLVLDDKKCMAAEHPQWRSKQKVRAKVAGVLVTRSGCKQ
jgi:hypothetical protein